MIRKFKRLFDLNFVPMGFETGFYFFYRDLFKFELCPYGIWNLYPLALQKSLLDLNFVPMGFETWRINKD